MAPKRQKTGEKQQDIRGFLQKENNLHGSSCNSPGKKSESQGEHPHSFEVIFSKGGPKYNVECKQPCTVLEAIKSHLTEEFSNNVKVSDENIIIKMGEQDNSPIVATHFPCCCVEDGKCLFIYTSKKVVQAPNKERPQILPPERYSIFFIDKEGGKHTRSKSSEIFRCTDLRQIQFGCYCVYGEKEMTVEEAIRQDGRFNDNLRSFTLSDKNKAETITKCTATIAGLNQREFKICLSSETKKNAKNPKQQMSYEPKKEQETACSFNVSQGESETQSVLKVAEQENISLKKAMEKTGSNINHNKIYDILKGQFKYLKDWVEKRFTDQSFRKALNLKKQEFGKIQQCFSKVHTAGELVHLSKSVCLLRIKETCSNFVGQGTGFVLFDNFILTNAHLFDHWSKSGLPNWPEYLNVTAEFIKRDPDDTIISHEKFTAKVCFGKFFLDYCLLELKSENQSQDQTEIPPGLLKRFGPLPSDDGACIIGYPGEEMMRMDQTCVIRPEQMEQAIHQNLEAYKEQYFTVYSISQSIIQDPLARIVVTYNTFMFHGSSGSPVFDASGRVFGLHSGGFLGKPLMPKDTVIEYAYPLLKIFEQLLRDGNEAFLARVREEAKGNLYLENIIESVFQQQHDDPMEAE